MTTLRPNRLRSGIFLAPFHPVNEDPTLALRRDIELIEHLDRLGFDEAWIGEHHSAGYEIIASPELMIAAAAERTQRIRIGTGVISLPYHHPLMVANRIVQLDHMTRGRAMFGVGPGLLPSDAEMLGVPVPKQRDRMAESLDVILRLISGQTVTEEKEWYKLNQARCQLLPYSRPRPEFAVASTFTPSGGKLAGKYNVGMLCVAASQQAGYDVLGTNWQVACEVAREHGREMDRSVLRLVAPMHIAETREQALRDVKFGLGKWLEYFMSINPTAPADGVGSGDPAEAMIQTGRGVIGTPDDAIAMIERLEKQSGGFGCMLMLAHNWANFEATRKSYELFARYVLPRFNGSNVGRVDSLDWVRANGAELIGKAMSAAAETVQKHFAEQAAKQQRTAARD
ncbi:MAG TPA: LLM class flavin-dependent oxidoreductase [Candidatus Binataceae bacterium]|nr:LLM class flavin-dependent oxidoreductase [Candidatus Binataceae bacterium]